MIHRDSPARMEAVCRLIPDNLDDLETKVSGRTERCVQFASFKGKEAAWTHIESQALEIGDNRLHRKVTGEDLSIENKQDKNLEAHQSSFNVVLDFIRERVIGQKEVVQLGTLRYLYVQELERCGFPNPDFRSDKLKTRLERHTINECIAITKVFSGDRGCIACNLVYSTSISVAEAVTCAYRVGSKDKFEDVAWHLRSVVQGMFNESTPLPWPPTADELDARASEEYLPTDLVKFLSTLILGEAEVENYWQKPSRKSTIDYFNPINQPFTEYSVIRELLKRSEDATLEFPEEYKKHVITLRPFHTVMNYIGMLTGHKCMGSGYSEILLEAGLVTSGCLKSVLKRKEYAKDLFSLKTVSEAMERLLIECFSEEEDINVTNPVALLNAAQNCNRESLDHALHDPSTAHISRVNHRLAIYKRADIPIFWSPKPYDPEQGWERNNEGVLEPVWSCGPVPPPTMIDLVEKTTAEMEQCDDDIEEEQSEQDSDYEELLTIQRIFETCTIHTTMGDIQCKLFPKECPKAVENFCVHSKNGYYNGHIFHRVIKSFMIQTGDPLGTGTGGESIWGEEFEDEFHPSLKHDRPYGLSLANAGPNTNGSQFFITVVPTPWLDNKHTVFGRVVKGMEFVQNISKVKTNPKTDKPYDDVRIININLK
ncbi:Peptidylprolyl isomerase domain and WD repeat-containing protein 1 [Nymphon striatum]|nr:Peptidylprolyl isomerase domain and WD repeat-containing protein 1 [Nymphon striatum]